MSSTEVEISVFGHGFGEAIAFCFKNNWILIDSCFDYKINKPATLAYLNNLSVDIKSTVKLVLLTHWHDDHIKGAFDLINECNSATIILPEVFKEKQFLDLYTVYSKRDMVNPNGLEELHKIIQCIHTENRKFYFGSVDKLLLDEEIEGHSLQVWSISPSDHASLRNQVSLSSLMSNCKQRINPPEQNHCAIATVIALDDHFFLFGADLENYKDDTLGWGHVLNHCNCIKNKKSRFFKISHHGSINGDHSDIWSNLLTTNPIAAMTPFSKGRKKLPTEADQKRIREKTDKAYLTCKDITSKYKEKRVLKITQGTLNNLKVVGRNTGQIRFKYELTTGNELIELLGDAVQL